MIKSKLMSYYYNSNRTVLPIPPVGTQADLMAWYDASKLSQTDSSIVSYVQDQSGNNLNLSSVTGPIYRASNIAGMPSMQFTGTQSLTGNAGIYTPIQVIFIAYSQRTGTNGTFISSTTGAKQLQRESQFWPNENNPSIASSVSSNTRNILRLNYNYTTDIYEVYQNKVLTGSLSGQLIDQNSIGQLLIGNRGGQAEYLTANIHEILYYNRTMTLTESTVIEDYLMKKWGFMTTDPEFTVNTAGWSPYVNGGTATPPTVTALAGECKIDVMGTYVFTGIESSTAIQFEAGGVYRLYWDARSVNNTTMAIYVSHSSNPSVGGIVVTPTKTTNFFEFTTLTAGSGIVYLRTSDTMINNPTLFLDNIYLRKVNTTPTNLGLIGWYNANNVVQSSNIVSQMTDISGSNNHLLQATTGQQPLLVAGSINSLPTVNFDGLDDTLSTPNPILLNNEHTVFIVYSVNSPGGVKTVLSTGQNAADGFNYRANGTGFFFVADGIQAIPAGNVISNQFEILGSSYNPVNNEIKVNRNNINTLTTTGYTPNASPGGLTLGNRIGSGEFSECKVAELLVYNRVLTTAEQATVYNFLKTKYNL